MTESRDEALATKNLQGFSRAGCPVERTVLKLTERSLGAPSAYDEGVLSADDELPARPHRILVAGVAGVGKSTLCRRIAAATGIPYTELDSLYHGPGWTPLPDFAQTVERITASPEWVTEWQYRAVRRMLLERADLLVWLDPPFRVTLGQIVRRTLRRRLRNEVLWNENTEPPLRTFFTDRDHIVRWTVRTRHKHRAQLLALEWQADGPVVVRLRSRRAVRHWLRGPLRRAFRSAP
jgi:adenylate kinase family enzyme